MNTNNTTVSAMLYLEEKYVVGQPIDLVGFLFDNGPIMMAASLLEELVEMGVLDVNHKGVNVDQDVAEYSYTYMGYENSLSLANVAQG